jgi:hypothetical protein
MRAVGVHLLESANDEALASGIFRSPIPRDSGYVTGAVSLGLWAM